MTMEQQKLPNAVWRRQRDTQQSRNFFWIPMSIRAPRYWMCKSAWTIRARSSLERIASLSTSRRVLLGPFRAGHAQALGIARR